jgi:hypothetical protein
MFPPLKIFLILLKLTSGISFFIIHDYGKEKNSHMDAGIPFTRASGKKINDRAGELLKKEADTWRR